VHEGGFGVQAAVEVTEVAKVTGAAQATATDTLTAQATRQRDFLFTRPDGSPLDEYRPVEKCFRGNMLPDRNRQHGIVIDPTTIDSRWIGERMDYSLAIDALIAARERSRAESSVNGQH
jgi:hypothetical protein